MARVLVSVELRWLARRSRPPRRESQRNAPLHPVTAGFTPWFFNNGTNTVPLTSVPVSDAACPSLWHPTIERGSACPTARRPVPLRFIA